MKMAATLALPTASIVSKMQRRMNCKQKRRARTGTVISKISRPHNSESTRAEQSSTRTKGQLWWHEEQRLAVVVPKAHPLKRQKTGVSYSSRLDALQAITALALRLKSVGDLQAGRLLDVPKTIFRTAFANDLYVRQEYWNLHQTIKHSLAASESARNPIRRVLVTGSPGVGKSVLEVFLLLLFMAERKNVVYRPLNAQTMYFFTWRQREKDYEITDAPIAFRWQ